MCVWFMYLFNDNLCTQKDKLAVMKTKVCQLNYEWA